MRQSLPRLPLLGALLAILCAINAYPRTVVWAHGALLYTSIAPGSLIADLPPVLTLGFSESLATRLSSLHVSGPTGADATVGTPHARPDDRSLQVGLRLRGGGTYTVSWSAVSAEDGHVGVGTFRFAVGYVSHASDLRIRTTAHASSALGVTDLLAAVTRWLLLVAAIAWAGGALFEMPPGTVSSRPALSGGDAWIALLAAHSRVVQRRLLEILLGVLAFSWLLEAAQLALAGSVTLVGGLVGLLDGHLGALRLLALVSLLLALVDLRRPVPVQPGAATRPAGTTPASQTIASHLLPAGRRVSLPAGPPLGRWGHLVLAALFLLSVAGGSHAGGVSTITLSAVLIEWLHSMAAAAWIGAMMYLVLIALPVAQNLDLDRRAPLTIGLLRRFIPFAAGGTAILAISGLFAAQVEVGTRSRLTGNPYGNALTLKLLLVLAALGLTYYLLSVQRGRIESIWSQRQRLESLAQLERIGRTLRAGAALGAMILASTAALWTDVPAALVPVSLVSAAQPPLPSGTWHSAGLSGKHIYRLLFDPRDRHTMWAATNAGVWRSTDDQHTWVQRGRTLARLKVLDLLPLDGGRGLLAAVANGQLYRTYDAGLHWQRLGRPFGRHPLRTLASNGQVLLAGGDDGLFRSVDDSKHWHRVLDVQGQGIASLYWTSSSGRFLAGAQRGPWQIFSAGPGGGSWQALPNAPGAQAGVLALAMADGAIQRAVVGTGGAGVWAAPTASGGWSQAATGLPPSSMVTALLSDEHAVGRVFLASANAGVYGSTDGATSWVPLGHDDPPSALCLAVRPGAVRILYAGTSNGVYKLTIGR